MSDIVYILTNEAMPDYIKVGITNDIERRVCDLDWTNIPLPFQCYYAAKVENASFVESQIFSIFADQRVRSNREFFRVNPGRVIAAIKLAKPEDITPEKEIIETPAIHEELEKISSFKKRFNFEAAKIPVGAELSFIRDESIKAKVLSNSNIELNGEVVSLSAGAKKLLNKPWPAQGPIYWLYEGETLFERRQRIEDENLEET
jgi:hypothetical protein